MKNFYSATYGNLDVAAFLFFALCCAASGCSAAGGGGDQDATNGERPVVSVGTGLDQSSIGIPDIGLDQEGPGGAVSTTEPVEIIRSLPDGFTAADTKQPDTSKGGYRVLGPLEATAVQEGECANVLRVVVRDFEKTHPDFENPADWNRYEVLSPLAASRKPEKLSETGPLQFDDWYQNVPGVNLPFAVDLWLEPVGDTFVFDSTAFFPLDGFGFQDRYLFTTELHTRFEYVGQEVFSFRGDDDVFVYINGHLAVNLSGVHNAQSDSVDLDERASEFEIEVGGVYDFDLFQAERQPTGSNFRLETTLDFTGCGIILGSDIVR